MIHAILMNGDLPVQEFQLMVSLTDYMHISMMWKMKNWSSSCEGESLNLQVTKILYGRNLLLTVMKDRKAIFTHTSYYSNSNLLPMIYGSVFRIRIIFLYILQMKAIIVLIY